MKSDEINKLNKKQKNNLLSNFDVLSKKTKLITLFAITAIIIVTLIVFLVSKGNNVQEDNSCIIQFNTNGGSPIDKIDQDCGLTIVQPKDPVKNGFDFLGWYYEDQNFDFSKAIDEDIVLQARWKAKEGVEIVTISFDSNGGSEQEDIEIQKGSFLTAPVDPVRDGYIFSGWYLDDVKFGFNAFTVTKDITLVAKWEKDNSSKNTNSNGNSQSQTDTSGKNVDKNEEDFDLFYKYDDIVEKYAGRWYLSEYEDIYLDVERKQYYDGTAMEIITTHFAPLQTGQSDLKTPQSFSIYPCSSKSDRINGCGYTNGITISYSDWDDNLKKEQISLGSNSINVGGYKFIRNKGTKNMLTGKMYTKALGIWYLYNSSESLIEICSDSDTVNTIYGAPWYWINTTQFNLNTFETNINYSTESDVANSDDLFNKYGISISGDVLTINNGKETRKFYRTKKYSSVKSVSLNYNSLDLRIGDTMSLKASINPSDAYNKGVSWKSSDSSIVNVDSSGNISALKEGTATITVTTEDGNKKATCNVTVKRIKVTSVNLNQTQLFLNPGQTYTLTATINPLDANIKDVVWSSDNEKVATVDSNGKVTAKSIGKATITVTTKDGNKTAKCEVAVNYPELKADAKIGISYACTNSGCGIYSFISIDATGGSGSYNYSYDVYKDGSYIGTYTSKDIYLPFVAGNYIVEYRVTDSAGNSTTGSVNTTLNP